MDYFNILFGDSGASRLYWSDAALKSDINMYFPNTFEGILEDESRKGKEEEEEEEGEVRGMRSDLRDQLDMCQLFIRLQGLTGITFSPYCRLGHDPKQMQKVKNYQCYLTTKKKDGLLTNICATQYKETPLCIYDIIELPVQVKPIPVISYAEAAHLYCACIR